MNCCDLTSGMLRHEALIQTQQRTPDGQGGFTVAWVDVARARVKLEAVSGREAYREQRLKTEVTHKAWGRYLLLPNDVRLVIEGQIYHVKSALDIEKRRRWLEFQLVTGVAS